MRALRLNAAILALWSVLIMLGGCTHKKPVLVAPQPLPPAAAPEPSRTPEPAQPAEQTQPAQDAQAPAQDQPKPETTQADKTKPPQKPSPRKPARKTVVGADKEEPAPIVGQGQISPAPTSADTSHAQGSTEQLLKTAEANLNSIKRPLSKQEEVNRSQALEFIAQSRKATAENDSTRAYNLAVKARLLSDELVQQH